MNRWDFFFFSPKLSSHKVRLHHLDGYRQMAKAVNLKSVVRGRGVPWLGKCSEAQHFKPSACFDDKITFFLWHRFMFSILTVPKLC